VRDLASARPRRLYYWIHHTGSYDGNTGVQRVVRMLAAALLRDPSIELVPVRWCSTTESIVRADEPFLSGFARYGGPSLPAPAEPGVALHLSAADQGALDGSWLLLGEVPHLGGSTAGPGPMVPVAFDYARYYGLRIAAVFYDLIPLRVGGYEAMAPAHAAYAAGLMAADIVLPISRTACDDLAAWWREQGHLDVAMPPLAPLLLPAEMVGIGRVVEPPEAPADDGLVRLLAVGTVEPRKNQLAVAEALNRLARRRPDLSVRLDIAGHLHPAVAPLLRAQVAQSGGRIALHQYLSDAEVRALTEACDATIFLSRAEGFGLPIGESLWQGRPCLCSDVGSMAEIAEGGGCLTVDPNDPGAIERALERIAEDRALRESLAATARSRPLCSWADYAAALLGALAAAPPERRLVVVEGSRGGTASQLAEQLASAAIGIRRLHWRADIAALLPGSREAPDSRTAIGGGDLRGLWAVLPLASVRNSAEALRIQDEVAGLGMKLAVQLEPEPHLGEGELRLLAGADLALFARAADLEDALARAFRTLNRTATLRQRWRTAEDAAALAAAIAARRSPIAACGAPDKPRRVFFLAGLTAQQPFNTGVQRVTRALARVLEGEGVEIVAVKWDEDTNRLALLDEPERAHLRRWDGPALAAGPAELPADLAGDWMLVPEIAVPSRPAGSNIAAYARGRGMRVAAILYDFIPLKMHYLYPEAMLPAFEDYWKLFGEADIALPISWTVAAELRRYLAERGRRLPAIITCPLAADLPGAPRARQPRRPRTDRPLTLIAIGTWEPRKNYPRLLRALIAARRLSAASPTGRPIRLTLVGRRAEFPELNAEINDLAAQAGDVTLAQHVSDPELLAMIDASDVTLFGSWEEGFGLPVLESLWRGLPCICHHGSAMAEVAPGGGTIAVDMLDEEAVAAAIASLATDVDLLARLGAEAVARPLRDWREYGRDVLRALAAGPAPRGWPRPAVIVPGERPLLSCAVTTYNRAHWLTHTLPRLIETARPFGSRVEVVVCDNTSTDNTPEIVARYAGLPNVSARRNPANVGMLGNLAATARAARGAYVWLIGDDDLVTEHGIGDVLEGLEAHPEVEMAYMNYAYTSFDRPEQLTHPRELVQAAHPIGYGGPNRRVTALREVAALNENLFTAIYACAFRRDHALRAYGQDVSGPPFSSLLTCIPSSVYALAALQDRPAWWVGRPALVVNLNVSWLRWVLLWHLARMPDLFDAAELAGIDPVRVDRHRTKHAWNAGEWVRMALEEAEDPVRQGISVASLIERCKHLPAFQDQLGKLHAAYRAAWYAGRVVADDLPPDELLERFGLLQHQATR